MKFSQIAFIDIETTNSKFSGSGGRILQYGLVLAEAPSLKILKIDECLVNPAHDMGPAVWDHANPEAMAVHGLTKELCEEKGISSEAAFSRIIDRIEWEKTCFASWGSFDMEFIRDEHYFVRDYRPGFKYRAMDVRSRCNGFTFDLTPDTEEWEYISCHEWAEVYETVKRVDAHFSEPQGPHNALYDAMTVYENFAHVRRVVRRMFSA